MSSGRLYLSAATLGVAVAALVCGLFIWKFEGVTADNAKKDVARYLREVSVPFYRSSAEFRLNSGMKDLARESMNYCQVSAQVATEFDPAHPVKCEPLPGL